MSAGAVVGNPLGFSKKSRLLSPWEYEHVFKHGRKLRSLTFMIVSCPNSKDYPRLGVTIAKRNIRLAHERNRIRRIIRESFRNIQGALKKMDMIVLVHRSPHIESNELLRQELEKQWQSLALR